MTTEALETRSQKARIPAIQACIRSFCKLVSTEVESAIGEMTMVKNRITWHSSGSKWEELCGVYIFSDCCGHDKPFSSERNRSDFTTIRYIGSTMNNFASRYVDHRKNSDFMKKDSWRLFEIIPISREYKCFAGALEHWLQESFPPTHRNETTAKELRAFEEMCVPLDLIRLSQSQSFRVWQEC